MFRIIRTVLCSSYYLLKLTIRLATYKKTLYIYYKKFYKYMNLNFYTKI